MWFQEGVTPFILSAAFMLVGLLIAGMFSLKTDGARYQRAIRFSNAFSILGMLLGFQFRLFEYTYGNTHFSRADNLPSPVLIVLMFGVYASLRVILTR